jgi:response regulator NasT
MVTPGVSDPTKPPARRTGPVLVVDDDAVVRRLICRALEEEGLRVVSAANGQLAVERARHHRPALVVLDVTLPLLSGDAVAAELRALLGDGLPILVVTADVHPAEKARALGAYAGMSKPFDVDALVGAVRRALEGA